MTPTLRLDFERPPVNEVVCGVVFEPLQQLSTAYLGLLWGILGEEFPQTADRPPIVTDATQLVHRSADGQAEVPVAPRVWFLSKDGRRLVQVQRDRLHFNWRRIEDDDEYPRFAAVYAGFVRTFGKFRQFGEEMGLGPVRPKHFELTYINVIKTDVDGSGPFSGLFRHLGWPDVTTPEPDTFQWVGVVRAGPAEATLRIVIRSATASEGQPVTTMELTVGGPASAGGDEADGLDEWFELAHNTVVTAFVELTAEHHQLKTWGKRA
jgi:uncharacterized protein (TIGR04255 family)